MIRPDGMLPALSGDGELQSIATEVECTMIEISQTTCKVGSPSQVVAVTAALRSQGLEGPALVHGGGD